MPWILFIAMLLFGSMAYAAAKGAPWVPTWRTDIDRLHRLLDLKEGEAVYELGCGDARVVLALAKRSGARGVGVELSLLQWMAAQLRRLLSRADASIRLGDAFKTDLRDADAVYLFLMPETYEKIRPKLEAELRPGARVTSYVWPIPGWEPAAVDTLEGKPDLFLYVR